MKEWTYRGITITRIPHSGMYSAWISTPTYTGYAKADTLAGMRELIRDYNARG